MTSQDNGVKGGEQFTFRLEEALRHALELIAEKNDRTLSAEIRRALKKHVCAEGKAT